MSLSFCFLGNASLELITKSMCRFGMSPSPSSVMSNRHHHQQNSCHHHPHRTCVVIFFWNFLWLSLFVCDHLCTSSSSSLISNPQLDITPSGSNFEAAASVQSNRILSNKIANVLHALNSRPHHQPKEDSNSFQIPENSLFATSSPSFLESLHRHLPSSPAVFSPQSASSSVETESSAPIQQQDVSESDSLQDTQPASPGSSSSSSVKMMMFPSLLTNRVENDDQDLDFRNHRFPLQRKESAASISGNPGGISSSLRTGKETASESQLNSQLESINNTLSNKRIKSGSTIDPETTLGCYRREYFFKAERTDASGRKCWSTVKATSCWGRCESGEVGILYCLLFLYLYYQHHFNFTSLSCVIKDQKRNMEQRLRHFTYSLVDLIWLPFVIQVESLLRTRQAFSL